MNKEWITEKVRYNVLYMDMTLAGMRNAVGKDWANSNLMRKMRKYLIRLRKVYSTGLWKTANDI